MQRQQMLVKNPEWRSPISIHQLIVIKPNQQKTVLHKEINNKSTKFGQQFGQFQAVSENKSKLEKLKTTPHMELFYKAWKAEIRECQCCFTKQQQSDCQMQQMWNGTLLQFGHISESYFIWCSYMKVLQGGRLKISLIQLIKEGIKGNDH